MKVPMSNQRDRLQEQSVALQEMFGSILREIDEEINMATGRPNYEALYKVAYRKHHELLGEIEDLLKKYDKESAACMQLTGEDLMGMLRLIHEKYIVHDWSH